MAEVPSASVYEGIVREHLAAEAARVRPFCGQWPFSSSDLDVVLPEANDAVHRARGCCDGPSANPPSRSEGTDGV